MQVFKCFPASAKQKYLEHLESKRTEHPREKVFLGAYLDIQYSDGSTFEWLVKVYPPT